MDNGPAPAAETSMSEQNGLQEEYREGISCRPNSLQLNCWWLKPHKKVRAVIGLHSLATLQSEWKKSLDKFLLSNAISLQNKNMV